MKVSIVLILLAFEYVKEAFQQADHPESLWPSQQLNLRTLRAAQALSSHSKSFTLTSED